MEKAYAVIGAGFGDEGKGLTVDFLTRILHREDAAPLVARCNGGAQAGHTVVTKEGQRHVFGHIGAGTFAGAKTYLSQNFILNPYVLEKELKELSLGVENILVHPRCRVTTIFDMALNALREMSRGSGRHGSCGLGINETVTRCEAGYELLLNDIIHLTDEGLADRLIEIFDEYWHPKFLELKDCVNRRDAMPYLDVFDEDADFEVHASKFNILRLLPLANNVIGFSRPDRPLIVEGAQGLMLDEHLGHFPHVTRSITGLPSALLAAHELGYKEITPVYVTRCYATRHGAGPLDDEGREVSSKVIPTDKTNLTGLWQGDFRKAPLNVTKLGRFIKKDMERSKQFGELLNIEINSPMIMLTCMDQMGHTTVIRQGDKAVHERTSELQQIIQRATGVKVRWISYGETAQDIKLTK